jgi:hypothetical protein
MSNLNLSSVSGKAVQAATFSRGAYDSKTPFVPPAGFEPLEVKLVNPQSPDFAASAYVNPKTGELVVAYRGSDSTTDLTTALKGAANGTWNGQFTDAAAYMKQAQGIATKVVDDYSKQEGIAESPKITTLTTGHSLGGMLAQVVAKMYGVEAQVQDAPGAARLIDTPQFKQAAIANGQPESGHDITGKEQNVTTSNIAKLGEQFEETQVVAIPALGQMGGMDTLATIGAFVANPAAGFATGAALQTVAEHSSEKIEDALHMLAGIKSQVADAGVLTLQPMYLDRDGQPVPNAPASQGDSSNSPSQIQALVDKSGKVVAFFDREVVDGEMQPVAVVVGSGNRIHLTHAQDGSSPQVIETTINGERRMVSQTELLTSLQDARGTPEINLYSADAVNGMDFQSDQDHKAQEGSSHTKADDTSDQQVQESNAASDATQQVVDAANNTNTFTNFLEAQGSTLTPAQQNALATQISQLNLGGEGDLSFYSLPNGGELIANADGDIVGEINRSASGNLNLKASGIDADGNSVQVNQHIDSAGTTLTDTQYTKAQTQQVLGDINQGLDLFNALSNIQNWSQLSDVGKLSAVVGLYNAIDGLGAAFSGSGNNLPGDLGAAAGWLSLAQGLQSGDGFVIAAGLNSVSDQALEGALNSAFGSTGVPYVSIALALHNFEDNPAQSIGTLAGMYFGGPIGGAIGGFIGGALGGMFGGGGPPPPPVGVASFSWDAEGNIQHKVDFDQSGGGSSANSLAASVQGLLAQVVQAINAQNPSTADDVAINPYLMPRVGCDRNGAWLEITLSDGKTLRENISSETVAPRLIELLQNNGGLAPAWQVQTEQVKWQHAHEQVQQLSAQREALLTPADVPTEEGMQVVLPGQEARFAELSAQLAQAQRHVTELPTQLRQGVGGGQVVAGNEAYSLQGNAVESTDFKSQTFGALVVHVARHAGVQASVQELNNTVVKTSEILRDADNDGYLEKTQWVSATDAQGNLQGLLTIDFNGNGQIETRDILNLSGNTGHATAGASKLANQTDEAKLATQNAAQQRNNVEWLDANGDGTLDKSDPAFAAIKLWIDANQDGQMQAGEGKSLAALHISSINFRTGEITYADGHRDALTATTLKADTEGVKFTQIAQVNPDGTLHTLDAGTVLEHEGYQGKVQVKDEGGTRWVNVREHTYEQQAKRTGDWEGTTEQGAHRHGGGNVAGAPTQTTATGATDFGPVRTQANQRTQSTVAAGDGRVVSDAPTQAPAPQTNAQTTIAAGDSRIKSNAATPNTTNTNTTNNTPRPADTRIAFVPTSQTSVQNEIRLVTDSMIESSQSLLFGGGSAGLGVLAAVGTGVTASAARAAEAAQRPVVVSEMRSSDANSAAPVVMNPIRGSVFSTTSGATNTDTSSSSVTFRQVDLGVFNVPQVVPSAPAITSSTGATPTANPTQTEAANTTFVQATVMVSAPAPLATSKASASAPAFSIPAPQAMPDKAMQAASAAPNAPTLNYPQVQAETLPGTEDVVLRLTQSVLLTNDRTPNASADPTQPALTITAVSQPLNGQVSLVNGEVLFAPDTNFHGTASFTYTVTDQYGLYTNGTATLLIAAFNDVPVTQGESYSSDEDIGLIFTQAQLLINDSDVDVATDGQVLSISRVGQAEHGTVWLDAQGNLRFVPDANYHGPAQFTYWVSDGLAANGAGAEVPATVSLTILAVNDLPVVTGETLNNREEDVPLLFNPATLLANDTDVDVATDGQVLRITGIGSAQHGAVAWATQPDGSQYIEFTPERNYFGVASYQYTVSDGNGGTATTTVVVNLAQVNDAPVAANDILRSTAEDTALHISFASLLGNDTDTDSNNSQWGGTNDVLTVTLVGNAVNGTVALVNGEVVFTPEANYHGPASFTYQVSDSSGAVSQALATFSVMAVNDAPVAVGETISEKEDTPLLITQAALLRNDRDVDTATDGQVLSITAVSNAQNGTVTLNANGTISFKPVDDFYGNASFDYTVNDGSGGTATATAIIALANVNDAPVATGETINSNEDEVLTIIASTLLQNDNDIDNARADLTISRVQSGTGGSVSLNASGNVVFTPALNYNGTATFTYWVKDPGGLESNAVTTTVVLAAVNDAPRAQGEIVTGASEDATFYIDKSTLLTNDHDIDDPDSALRLSWVGNASNGEVSLDANGNVVYKFTQDFNGNATFEYKVRDAAGLESAVVQAVIPVAAVNDKPVAVDDQFTTYKNSTMTIAFNELTGNDTDADGDTLTVSAVRSNATGHASIVNGQVQFEAGTGFTGQASFDYLTDDGHGGQTWATAFVDVKTPPNLYPTLSWNNANVSTTDGTWKQIISGYVYYSPIDESPNLVQITFDSAKGRGSRGGFGGGNTENLAFTQSEIGIVIDTNNQRLSWSIGGTRYRYLDYLEVTWKLVDVEGLENFFTWRMDGANPSGPSLWNFESKYHGYYTPPVILDLNGDGVHFTSLQNSSVTMDVNFDGIKDKMAWAGNDDGVLVWDKDHNHQITDASEFGFQTLKAGAQTDLEGLQALDTNGNGLLDAGDAKFAEFAVWQDANGNGVTDAGEFKTLTELGIANINLHSDGQMRDAGTLLAHSGSGETDATVMGNAAFTRTDGSTGVVADTMLAYEPGHAKQVATQVVDTSASDAQTAEIIRQALLFNQVCNTAAAIDSTPLGFVPIQPEVQLHDLLVTTQDGSHQHMQTA